MNLFYSKNTTINQNEIVILDQENRHLTKVLRKKIGDKIYVRDIDADKFDILTAGNAVVVAVKTARNAVEEESEEDAEGEGGAEGAEAPTAEAPAAEAPAAE